MTWYAVLTTLLLASVAAGAALVAIWAATSERHWFWRALAVWACVAVLLPIRVWEPAMVFAFALPLIVGLVRGPGLVWSWLGSERARRVRFGLLDVLLVMVIVGLSLAALRWIGQSAPRVSVYEVAVPALVMAGLAGAAYWMVVGPWRLLAGVAVIVLVPLGSWLLWPGVKWLWYVWPLGLSWYKLTPSRKDYLLGFQVSGIGLAEFLAMVFCGCLIGMIYESNHRQWRILAQATTIAVAMIFAGGAAWLYARLLPLTAFPATLAAQPNNAARILQIAKRVKVLNPPRATDEWPASSYPRPVAEELYTLYDELLVLLQAPNSMTYDPVSDSKRSSLERGALDRMQLLRHLVRCLGAERREAEAQSNRKRAIEMSIAIGRIGNMLRRNSIEVDFNIGTAFLRVAQAYLIEKRGSFSNDEMATISAALQRLEAEHEPIEQMLQREQAFNERGLGWQWRIPAIIYREDWSPHLRQAHRRWLAVNRLLLTDLAIRQYQREHQSWPASIVELVPRYLEKLPIDPFSEASFVYRVQNDDFVLYSVGQDRVDNGGRFGTGFDENKSGYDLDLDTYTRVHDTESLPASTSDGSGAVQQMNHEGSKDTKKRAPSYPLS